MRHFLIVSILFPALSFADTDQDLNSAYQEALKTRPQYSDLIKKSQISWLKFIDAECKAESRVLGGQLFTVEYDSCIDFQKNQRTKSIRETYLYQ